MRELTDEEERQLEERVKKEERLKTLELAIDRIKELVMNIGILEQKEYEELIGEIKWTLEDL